MRINELEQLIEEKPVKSDQQECVRILLQALNDWPTEIESTDRFIQEISTVVKGELNEVNIRIRLSKVEFATEAWLAESLTELTEIFAYFPQGENINQILSSIEDDLRT